MNGTSGRRRANLPPNASIRWSPSLKLKLKSSKFEMNIQSIRLKNIRSYGEGTIGDGITVQFRPGVNRVAGRNGHGKTTIIEALGYALFFSEPSFVENFSMPTYLLRARTKDGETDVVFEHEGLAYRVERGLGASRRRSKVVQLSDESTCAMDDAEVSAWLCRLFGFDTTAHLSSLFSNLVGIKQGRLTRPLDSTKKEAKEFFEPLLGVAIFRLSTEQLADTQRSFKDLISEQENKSAGVAERMRMLADSEQKVPVREVEADVRARNVDKLRKQKDEADSRKQALEQKHAAIIAAKTALEDARNQARFLIQRRETDQQRLKEAEAAAALGLEAQAGHESFVKAEAALRGLHQQQSERAECHRLRAEVLNLKTSWQSKHEFAAKQIDEHRVHHSEKLQQLEALRLGLGKLEIRLEELTAAGLKQRDVLSAQRARDALEAWIGGISESVERSRHLLDGLLKDFTTIDKWDKSSAAKMRVKERALEGISKELDRKLTRAAEARESLSTQLAQIRGGVCPFLKEKCRQFDAQAIEADLGQRDKDLALLIEAHKKALKDLEEARAKTEKLAEQESKIAYLVSGLPEQIRRFTEIDRQLVPDSIRKNATIVQEFLAQTWAVDWSGLEAAMRACVSEAQPGSATLTQCFEATVKLAEAVRKEFQSALGELQTKFDEFDKQRSEQVRQQRDLENGKEQIARLEGEIKAIGQKLETLASDLAKATSQVLPAQTRIAELDEKLKPFVNLDELVRAQNVLKDQCSEAHKIFLGAKPLADQLAERREMLHKSVEADVAAQAVERHKKQAFETISHEFDPKALDSAREAAAAADKALAMEMQGLKDAERG